MRANEHIRIGSNSHERVKNFKYLGFLLKNQDRIHEQIKFRHEEGKSFDFSVLLLSKYLKIKIHKTIVLPIVLYDYGTWSLTLREDCRIWVFENRILRP